MDYAGVLIFKYLINKFQCTYIYTYTYIYIYIYIYIYPSDCVNGIMIGLGLHILSDHFGSIAGVCYKIIY